MLKRLTISLLLLLGALSQAKPVTAQALLPYTLPLDNESLQSDGLRLAQEATELARFQQFDEALARAQLASQLNPGDADILALLGSLYLQASNPQPERAILTLERAKALQPDNPLVMFALGNAYFTQGNYPQAARSIEDGLKLEPDSANARFDLGNAYFKLNRYDDAIAEYEQAITNEAAFWPAVNNIGLVMYEAGNVTGAIAKWEEAISLAGTDVTEPQLAIAVARYRQNGQNLANTDAAIAALERDPRYADIAFLEENLWGTQLITDTQQMFGTSALQELLSQL